MSSKDKLAKKILSAAIIIGLTAGITGCSKAPTENADSDSKVFGANEVNPEAPDESFEANCGEGNCGEEHDTHEHDTDEAVEVNDAAVEEEDAAAGVKEEVDQVKDAAEANCGEEKCGAE